MAILRLLKRIRLKGIAVLAFALFAVNANAQWSAGISAGWDYNWPSVTKGYATDVTYTGQSGFDVSLMGEYSFFSWLAVRADLRLDTRNYKMTRNYYPVRDVYTLHRDLYLHLPVVADLSFGGAKLRGHVYLGGYVGCWLLARRSGVSIINTTRTTTVVATTSFDEIMEFDSRRDNRFNAGLTGGLGIGYAITPNWEVLADAFLMYDLTTSNRIYMVANPRYNTTLCINVGVAYNF